LVLAPARVHASGRLSCGTTHAKPLGSSCQRVHATAARKAALVTTRATSRSGSAFMSVRLTATTDSPRPAARDHRRCYGSGHQLRRLDGRSVQGTCDREAVGPQQVMVKCNLRVGAYHAMPLSHFES
jgi:hypothetical protein